MDFSLLVDFLCGSRCVLRYSHYYSRYADHRGAEKFEMDVESSVNKFASSVCLLLTAFSFTLFEMWFPSCLTYVALRCILLDRLWVYHLLSAELRRLLW